MTQAQLDRFILYLQKANWLIFGPTLAAKEDLTEEEISPYIAAHQPPTNKEKGVVLIKPIQKPGELVLDERLPFFSFKRFFVPENEILFEYKNDKFEEKKESPKIALLGI